MADDVAKLEIQVDSKGVDRARNALGRFTKGAKQAETATAKLGRRSRSMTGSLVKGAIAVAGVTSAVVLLRQEIGRFLAANIKFEKSMSGVEAVTRATGLEMAAMTEQAKKLGEGTVFSASQAAEGMKFLGQAGFDASEILGAMPGLLDLAAAGSLDLANAADIASNIMSGFNIEAKESNRVANVLAKIAASANTNVEQLGQGMKFVAPVAAALGISLEETASAMGVLSDAGIQADMAGTGLRLILTSLLTTTPKADAALERMGLTLEDISPKTHTFSEIVDTLRKHNIGATEAAEIFGRRGVSAILALTSKTERIKELNQEFKTMGDFAKESAEILTSNLAGSITKFGSAVEGASLRLAEQSGLIESLTTATDAFTEFFLQVAKTNKELLKAQPIEDTIARINALEEALTRTGSRNRRGAAGIRETLKTLSEVRDEFLSENLAKTPQALDESIKRINDQILAASNNLTEVNQKLASHEKAREAAAGKKGKRSGRSRARNNGAEASLKAESEEIQKQLDILKKSAETLTTIRSDKVQAGQGFGFEVSREILDAKAEVAALHAKFIEQNTDLTELTGDQILERVKGQEEELAVLQKIVDLKERELATFESSGDTPDDTDEKRVKALAKIETIEAENHEASTARMMESIEGVKAYLMTEEQLILAQYEERKRLIEENTALTDYQQFFLLDALKIRLDEELAIEADQRSSKVDAIEESLMTELERLAKHHQDRRDIIVNADGKTKEERDALLLKLDKKYNDDVTKIEKKSAKDRFKTAQKLFGDLTTVAGVFASDSKGIMKGLHAVNQAFNVANAIMDIEGAIAKAWNSAPFPANLGAVASVAAGTGGIISTITGSNFSARDHGGLIPPGAMGLVGEFGPELVSGPMNVSSTRTTAGRGGAGGGMMKIEVINNAGAEVSVQSDEELGRARIIIGAAVTKSLDAMRLEFSEETLTANLKDGQGDFSALLDERYQKTA